MSFVYRPHILVHPLAGSPPFLSIVTRSYKRPNYLKKCLQSVFEQHDPDFQHIVLFDDVGVGSAKSNQALSESLLYVTGEYVLIVDDDDIIEDRDFIRFMKMRVISNQKVLGVIMQARVPGHIIPTDNQINSHILRESFVSSSCFCLRQDIFNRFIQFFSVQAPGVSSDRHGGDFSMIDMVSKSCELEWHHRVVVHTPRWNFGQPESDSLW